MFQYGTVLQQEQCINGRTQVEELNRIFPYNQNHSCPFFAT
jgi:hypothetical protein